MPMFVSAIAGTDNNTISSKSVDDKRPNTAPKNNLSD